MDGDQNQADDYPQNEGSAGNWVEENLDDSELEGTMNIEEELNTEEELLDGTDMRELSGQRECNELWDNESDDTTTTTTEDDQNEEE